MRLQVIDIKDRGLFTLCELRLYLPFDVQRKCYEWIKLATTNFQDSLIIWAKTPQNPRDVAPLNFIFITVFVFVFLYLNYFNSFFFLA